MTSEGRGTERSEQRTEQRTPDDLQPAAFDLFKVYFDKKLSNFKHDISETSEINSEKIVKKLKNLNNRINSDLLEMKSS